MFFVAMSQALGDEQLQIAYLSVIDYCIFFYNESRFSDGPHKKRYQRHCCSEQVLFATRFCSGIELIGGWTLHLDDLAARPAQKSVIC
jgi:hypothetical protein